jgi:hypothetical protein
MIARCYCKGSPSYKNYGARGITVDRRWRGYPEGLKAFAADMGMPPSADMTLERIDEEGPYALTTAFGRFLSPVPIAASVLYG